MVMSRGTNVILECLQMFINHFREGYGYSFVVIRNHNSSLSSMNECPTFVTIMGY